MKYVIEKDVAQAILNYLSTRPYTEVFQLVPLLQAPNLKPLEEESKDEAPENE